MAPVYAYLYSAQAGFYEILAGHLIKETSPAPISADQITMDAPPEKIEAVIESMEGRSDDAVQAPAEETAEAPAAEDAAGDADAPRQEPPAGTQMMDPDIPEEFREDHSNKE